MPREFSRRQRVAGEIQKDLGELIATRLKDPRVRMVTITEVDVSPDLKHAKVYVGVFDIVSASDTAPDVLAGLKRASGFLRRELGKRLRLRTLPELRFQLDRTERDAQHLEDVIRQAVNEDAQRHVGADHDDVDALDPTHR